jgi:PKD repeat protein
VANMSLGGQGTSSSLQTAIQKCVGKGVVVVVAAGNSGADVYGSDGVFGTSDDYIPAAYKEVATISALCDTDGKPGGLGSATSYGKDDSFATFSNYSKNVVSGNPVTSDGKAIDLILPGVNIYSTYKSGGYATASGTSMASPHAAGLAAMYIVKNGRANGSSGVYAIRQALIDAGKAQTDSDYGLINGGDPDPNKEKLGWAGNATPVDNQPPVANAGPDQTLSDTDGNGTATVSLDGSKSTDDKGITSYIWTIGTDEIATGPQPDVDLPVGTHNIKLTVSDEEGLAATDYVSVTIRENQIPSANFDYSLSGLTVVFTDKSTDDGTITSWSWSFGDGATSTSQNPSHTYAADGTYEVSLTVTDNVGKTGTGSKFVTVTQTDPSQITLTATGGKNKGRQYVNLTWTGATSDNVDIYRDGAFLITVENTGSYTDDLNKVGGGTYVYRVCEAETSTCSNDATVVF